MLLVPSRISNQPHHYVFDLLMSAIIRSVKIEAILQHLIGRGVVSSLSEAELSRLGRSKNGMKILIGHLKNKGFDTFLGFVECIFLAQGEDPSKAQSVTIVGSIIRAVEEYDQRKDTSFAGSVVAIQQKYLVKLGCDDSYLSGE